MLLDRPDLRAREPSSLHGDPSEGGWLSRSLLPAVAVCVLAWLGLSAAGCGGDDAGLRRPELSDPGGLITAWRHDHIEAFPWYELDYTDISDRPGVVASSLGGRRVLVGYRGSSGHTNPLVEVNRAEDGLTDVAVTLRLPRDGAVSADSRPWGVELVFTEPVTIGSVSVYEPAPFGTRRNMTVYSP